MLFPYAGSKPTILFSDLSNKVTNTLVTEIPVDRISMRRGTSATVAVIGNPNSGKSTLFNRLTGMRQKTANYPGVTVERRAGIAKLSSKNFELVDLPGLFSLAPFSLEEQIATNVVLGKIDKMERPDAVLAVVDATHLYQGLFLVQQLLELGYPVLVALTMIDAAEASGVTVDVSALSDYLGGVQVCPVVATTGYGLAEFRIALESLPESEVPQPVQFWAELTLACEELRSGMRTDASQFELIRALIDCESELASEVVNKLGSDGDEQLESARKRLFDSGPPAASEARYRYAWIQGMLKDVRQIAPVGLTWSARFVDFINRPLPGTLGLFLVMAVIFQAVFAWATPLMDGIEAGTAYIGTMISATMPAGALSSFLADGIVAGVGSVIVFLPQILILFLFIIFLEDTGYLARAAYLMDRLMYSVGLSGQSIIPMISSFACAVPGIMATRVIPNRRDRVATILAAPFMTCSARLPVYALLIAAFVPPIEIGFLNLQGVVLFGLYMLGIVGGLATALLLRKTALHGPKPTFALMLPEFRKPNLRTVALQLFTRGVLFLKRAGTVIFAVAVVIWALAFYPRSQEIQQAYEQREATLSIDLSGEQLDAVLEPLRNERAAAQLEQSFLGRTGKFIQPIFAPLGWDWKVSAAVIASFPAREVVIAVLGTVYAVGDEANEATLTARLTSAKWPDGTAVFTLSTAIGLLIFYAFCLQCAATVAVIRRETNSWRWPVFAWVYMTSLGYLGAFIAFQLGN